MFKLNNRRLVTKVSTIYDIQGHSTDAERQAILKKALTINPRFVPLGGTSATNPYKKQYDVFRAEQREQLEMYKSSVLWSPEFTPTKFRFMFLYPLAGALFLLWYIRFIQWPKKMMQLKREKGIVFKDLEAKGWLVDWVEEEEQALADYTLQDLEVLAGQKQTQPKQESERHAQEYFDRNRAVESESRVKMQRELESYGQ